AHGAGVPGDGRLGEAGQLGDRELLLDLAERLGGRAPPRAEHDRGAERLLPGAVAQLVRCFSGQDGRIGGQGRLSSRSSVPAVILPPQPPRWPRSAPFSIAPRRRRAGPGAEKGRAPGPAPTPAAVRRRRLRRVSDRCSGRPAAGRPAPARVGLWGIALLALAARPPLGRVSRTRAASRSPASSRQAVAPPSR